jgi:hypothetical protein
MLIVALVLAVVGLAALVTAVVTSNELVAWVCIAASVLGVILLIIDAVRERQHRAGSAAAETDAAAGGAAASSGEAIDATYQNFDAEYPEEPVEVAAEEPAVTPAEAQAADAPTAVHPVVNAVGEEDATEQADESSTDDDATKGSR